MFPGQLSEDYGIVLRKSMYLSVYCLLYLFIVIIVLLFSLCLVAKLLLMVAALFISSSIVTKYLDALL